MNPTCKLVIFDLDGTLLDTLSDLAHSANFALAQNGYPVHPIEAYKFFVGEGINKLLERALPENHKSDEIIDRIKCISRSYYNEHIADYTTLYPGIRELIKTLQSKGIKLAVASNKYQKATEKLIRLFFPVNTFKVVLGQRDNIPIKPDPTIVFDILKLTGVSPDEAIYIGDSAVDMQTAANSGVKSIGVTWGFRPREELESAGATYIVNSTAEILDII